MGYVSFNPNPIPHNRVGDCVIRAISKALGKSWEETYIGIALQGFSMGDLPSANHVWGQYLRDRGFSRHMVPEEIEPYTVADFASDHLQGTYVLALNGHVVCVVDGDYYDTWDSGNEIILYYWARN